MSLSALMGEASREESLGGCKVLPGRTAVTLEGQMFCLVVLDSKNLLPIFLLSRSQERGGLLGCLLF